MPRWKFLLLLELLEWHWYKGKLTAVASLKSSPNQITSKMWWVEYQESKMVTVLLLFVAIFIPPVPVAVRVKFHGHFWLNILLWICGWIPGRSRIADYFAAERIFISFAASYMHLRYHSCLVYHTCKASTRSGGGERHGHARASDGNQTRNSCLMHLK